MVDDRSAGAAPLAALIQRRLRAGAGSRRSIGRADRGQPLPLSAGQEQMWFLHRFDPAGPAYLMSWVLRLTGGLDSEGLRRAWERVVERHEILRTRYAGDDEPVQIIDPPDRFELRVLDLTGEPSAHREQRARRIAEWERRRPFDLTTDHPLRVSLIELGPELHLMVVDIHHIAFDGASYPRIAAELSALYAEQVTGVPADLPPVRVQYADFAVWERAGRTSGALRPHLDYWRRMLGDGTDLPLPTDRPRPVRPDPRGATVDVLIKPGTGDAVRALAAGHRASPYMVLLAAYHALLADLAGSADVAVGVPVSGRTVPELDEVAGYLVNTLVIRSRPAPGGSFADLLGQVRERFLDAFDHRDAPFKWVVEEVNPARAAGGNPLFRAAFDMEPVDPGCFAFTGLRVEQIGSGVPGAAKFDVTLHVAEGFDKQIFARLEYAVAVIDEDTAEAWASYCAALLEAVVRDPDEPLDRIRQRLGPPHRSAAPVPEAVTDRSGPATGPATGPVTGPPIVPARLLTSIRRVWCEVLGDDDIEVTENFFDVGGDSLRAVALAGRLREEGLAVSAADIFAYQTIEALAAACAGDPQESAPVATIAPYALLSPEDRVALPPDVVDAYPLAATQLGMIIELRARPDVNTYQDSTSYLIRDDTELDVAALQRATQLVVDRHEVLRTTFDLNRYSVPLQLVHRTAAITVGVTSHGMLGPSGWRPRLEAYAAAERRSPMDLAVAPLIRVHAHTADDASEWWITITECHPILEGWSFHTMLMEVLTGYQELRAGRVPAEPEPVAFRYADHVAAEAVARRSEEHRAYWKGVVAGRADVTLPAAWQDAPETPRDRYQHLVAFFDLDDDLRRLAAETRTSMKAVLLSAHLKVMSMVCGSPDFFTGLVCDARPEVTGADRVLGMYLNTVPFAMPAGARTWGELVRAVYDGLTAMWPHRVYPMPLVQQELGGAGRLLDIFFNYLDFHQVDGELIDEERTYNDNDNEFALHVFTLPGILKFNTTNHRLSRAAARRLASLYRAVLEEMSFGPDGNADSACLPADERAPLRDRATRSATDPAPPTVLESFTRVVRDRPDRAAVQHAGQSLTYRQLDSAADAIVHRLRRRGVGRGDLIAIAPRRDFDTPAIMLAAWKLGAAWRLAEPGQLTEPWQPAESSLGAPPAVPRPEDIACVLGGAVFTQQALAYAMESVRAGLALEPGSSWAIGALSELLVPLSAGGRAVLTMAEPVEAVPELQHLIAHGSVTHFRSTRYVAERVLADRSSTGLTAILGGATAIEVDALPGWVTFDGEPLPGVGVRVVDADLRPVATGVPGELCLTGPALAESLHDDPAATAERFAPDPAGDSGSRLYRTGLLARFAAGGTLQPLGPVDQRVRVDGHLVDPARTRQLLEAQPSVVDGWVLRRRDAAYGKDRLVGFVRTDAGASFDEVATRKGLAAARVPRHLIPDVLIRVAAWPLTSAGTIDENRLPGPPAGPSEPVAGARSWDDQFDTLLREALAGVDYAGEMRPDLSLTDAGLDSFATVGLLVAIEQSYGITIPEDLPVVDMFRTPSSLWGIVAGLLDAI
jgi:non-ribosomal peptide synthetase component F/acyl carrier protein